LLSDVPTREAIGAGLEHVDALKPGQGFAVITAGARGEGASIVGFARGEVGARLTPGLSLFGFGEATLAGQLGAPITPWWQAGVGLRATW
jgi:hypothetical protein